MRRRDFLKTGSALPFAAWTAGADERPTFLPLPADAPAAAFLKPAEPIHRAADVLNVRDFESLARRNIPPAHFGYLATGMDDDLTLLRNEQAYLDYGIRARRFVDLTRLDTGVSVFGARWSIPVYLSAVSAMRAFHPEGEVGVARAARARSVEMMLSSGSSNSLADVMAARGAPVWQQLYATNDWSVTEALVRRAEAAGSDAIALTVDSTASIKVRN